MKIAIYGELHGRPLQRKIYSSAINGFISNGDITEIITNPYNVNVDDFDALFHWSVPNPFHGDEVLWREKRFLDDLFKSKNKPIIVMEAGFIKREWENNENNAYFSFGLNCNIGFGNYNNKNRNDSRWKKLNIDLKDYRKSGNHILICSQLPFDSSLFYGGENHLEWCENIIKEIRNNTDRGIVFRKHPLAGDMNKTINKIKNKKNVKISTNKKIIDDFNNCWATVMFSSTSGVESIIHGIPCFTFGKGSMVYDISDHDISNINTPTLYDRDEWKNGIAYSQWKFDEISSGEAWKDLTQIIGV